MHRFSHFPLLLAAFAAASLSAQAPFSPADFTSPRESVLLEKMDARLAADIDDLPKENRAEYKKIYTDRADEMKDRLTEGHFIFEPAWQSWLDGILAEIWRANPGLPKTEVRFFIGRYAEPNAVSFGEGSIVFNVGLLPFLENEAQVAFVLCHEIAHYARNHSGEAIRRYVQTLYSKETQAKLRDISKSEYGRTQKALDLMKTVTLGSRRHSRFKETEADSLAIVYLSGTRYDPAAVLRTLEILDRTDSVEQAEIAYKSIFDAPQFPFRSEWLAQKRNSLSAAANLQKALAGDSPESDSLKTHPDCLKRRARAERQMEIGNLKTPGKSLSVQSDSTFQKFKKWSTFEVLEGLYYFENYGECLYRALGLLQKSPDDAYLNAMTARCLHHLHRSQKEHRLNVALELPDPDNHPEYDKFLRFMNQFRLRDLAQMTYYFCENRLEKLRGNEDFFFAATLSSRTNDLTEEFQKRRREYNQKFPRGKYGDYLKEL